MTANRKILAVETMEKSGERLDNCENVNHNPATFLSQQKNNRTTKPHDTYTADTLGYKKGNAQVGTFGTVETMESDVEMQKIHENVNRDTPFFLFTIRSGKQLPLSTILDLPYLHIIHFVLLALNLQKRRSLRR